MNLHSLRHCWGAAALGVAFSLSAQTSSTPSLPSVTNPVLAAQSAPLFPSPAKAPVEFFRALLAMSPVERSQALSYRTAQNQKLILDKVHEYEMLPPDARELRLSLTELRWYLLRLMPVAPTNRPARLAQVPLNIRSLVEDRLKQWDKLTAAQQAALLENEAVIRYFAERAAPPLPFPRTNTLSPPQNIKLHIQLHTQLQQWGALSDDQREEILANFNSFFVLTSKERERTLNSISEPERRQIENTLKAFDSLPQSRRERCLVSFGEFADLSPSEREEFFKNVERWNQMTPSQRDAWRELVQNLARQPPLPSIRKRPPLPPRQQEPLATVAGTNQH